MRRLNYVMIILLLIAMLMPTDLYGARRKKKRRNTRPSSVISYVHGYAGLGYSSLLHGIDQVSLVGGSPETMKVGVPGGAAGVLGFGYTLKHKRNPFMFKVGLEFMYLNSQTSIGDFTQYASFKYTHPGIMTPINVNYRMDFENYIESQNRFSVGLPILFGAQFKEWYFGVGVAPNFGFVGNYKSRTKLTTTALDDELFDDYENMPNHSFMTSKPNSPRGKIGFAFDIPVRVEGGVILDQWMPRSAIQMRNKDKTKLSYRAGLFAEYGITNINANMPAEGLLNFPDLAGGKMNPNEIHNVTPNSVLQNKGAAGKALNSLVIGAKFEVMVKLGKEPPKRKIKRRPPKKRKPRPQLPDPPYFFAVVSDYETEEYLSADLKLFKLTDTNDTVFAATTSPETGFTETRMKSDDFGIIVTKPGYITYRDTVYGLYNDTLYVDLQPIKENTIVVLENLLFDTDKTVIKNASTQSLDEMFTLLRDNPEIIIEISGHTDDVGSARYNRKLSEGRAKAVYDEMVKRGIDPKRMTWRGAGEDEPIDTNKTKEGRQENRRVEFEILEQ